MIAALPARDRAPRRVLVTGGSGHIGRHVVNGLVARGALVRTLTRRPGRSVQRHVEAVRGDLCDPATMRRALAGMDALFLIWPLLETEPAEPLVDTIGRSSVRVVYVSSTAVVDSAANQSDPIVQVHADMEALLTMAGVRTLMLRSDTLACNALGWASQVAASDVVRGQDVASTAVVDERDVDASGDNGAASSAGSSPSQRLSASEAGIVESRGSGQDPGRRTRTAAALRTAAAQPRARAVAGIRIPRRTGRGPDRGVGAPSGIHRRHP